MDFELTKAQLDALWWLASGGRRGTKPRAVSTWRALKARGLVNDDSRRGDVTRRITPQGMRVVLRHFGALR